jgi:general secretion pathway protein A
MYLSFYELLEKPFNLTPSTRFLYLGESHKEALALLTYGITERKGFVLLTGEVGTGKTTMVQALLQGLDENMRIVCLSNPLMTARDLIHYIGFSALKRKEHYRSKAEFLLEFEEFLKQCRHNRHHFTLIVDEAQKLSFDLLEEIRLLSNMESSEEKLINIFLVGQPELNEKLNDMRCRPLLQRISVRHHIRPLDLGETRDYVLTRLRVAGAKDGEGIFSKGVIKAIHDYSKGYPRMINILADNALLLGYARGEKKITPSMIEESYGDLQLEGSFLRSEPQAVSPKPGVETDRPSRSGSSAWKWAAIVFFFVMMFAFALLWYWQEPIGRLGTILSESKERDATPRADNRSVVRRRLDREDKVVLGQSPEEKQIAGEESPLPTTEEGGTPPLEIEALRSISADKKEPLKTAIVKEGDTLAELATSMYGRVNGDILRLIQRNNPGVQDIDRIRVGQRIVFPPLD